MPVTASSSTTFTRIYDSLNNTSITPGSEVNDGQLIVLSGAETDAKHGVFFLKRYISYLL